MLETATLTSREQLAPGFWYLGFASPRIAAAARSAQYVAIDVPGPFAVRLPLGIWTAQDGEITFLFREWGDRTKRLAELPPRTELSFIGPLGNEFAKPGRGSRATIAAGGLGIVPFWLLGRELLDVKVPLSVVFGARTRELLVGADRLQQLGLPVELCTDDGSLGARGSVVDVLRAAPPADIIYGCGPPGMLKSLCAFANESGVRCQISMEETFGCSMGTCWGCVVPVRRGCEQDTGYPKAAGERREYDFARVCADGTVFWAADVLWLE